MIHKRHKTFFVQFKKLFVQTPDIVKFAPKRPSKLHFFLKINNTFQRNAFLKLIHHSEITFVLTASLAIFLIFVFVHYFFMISQVGIKDSNGIPIVNWKIEGLEKVQGKNILLLSSDEIEQSIRSSNPSIKSLQVIKVYPKTIDLLIQFQKPVAYFTYNNTRFFLLSNDGTLLSFSYERPSDMGEILYYQYISPGEYGLGQLMGSRDIQFAAKIAGILQKYGFPKFTITISDSHLITAEMGDLFIKTASDSENAKQLSSIEQIVRIIRKGGEKIKSVDVRFEKIIIEK